MGYRKTRGFRTLARTRLNRVWPRGFTEDGGSYRGYLQRWRQRAGGGGDTLHLQTRWQQRTHTIFQQHGVIYVKNGQICHKNTLFFSHVGDNFRVKRLFFSRPSCRFPLPFSHNEINSWWRKKESNWSRQTVKVSRAKRCHLNLEEKQKKTPEGLPIILTRLSWASWLSLPRFFIIIIHSALNILEAVC